MMTKLQISRLATTPIWQFITIMKNNTKSYADAIE
jgi:hypothetical protein